MHMAVRKFPPGMVTMCMGRVCQEQTVATQRQDAGRKCRGAVGPNGGMPTADRVWDEDAMRGAQGVEICFGFRAPRLAARRTAGIWVVGPGVRRAGEMQHVLAAGPSECWLRFRAFPDGTEANGAVGQPGCRLFDSIFGRRACEIDLVGLWGSHGR